MFIYAFYGWVCYDGAALTLVRSILKVLDERFSVGVTFPKRDAHRKFFQAGLVSTADISHPTTDSV